MTIAARMLIDQGAALAVPPRSRGERQAFASWLASALQFVGMSRASLVSRTGISREDIDAMLDDESRGTAKGDRAFVHDFFLDRIEECDGSSRPHGDDATSRVSDVVAGRAEFATFFSPRDDLRSAIVRVIESARAGILIQAWDLSCKIIGDALMAAKVGQGRGKIMIAVSTTRGEKLSAALQALAAEPRVRVLRDRDGRNNHNKTSSWTAGSS